MALWLGGCDSVILELPIAILSQDDDKLQELVVSGYDHQDGAFRFIGPHAD